MKKETFTERRKKLSNAIDTLKNEFVGIDPILDKIEEAVSSYYLCPEIQDRPTIVSLFGPTGTGKTSVVKRLLEILNIDSIQIDCGESRTNEPKICSDIMDSLGLDKPELGDRFYAILLDEFQLSYSINPNTGEENESKPGLRAIWNLLDTGILQVSEYSWEYNKLITFYEDLKIASKQKGLQGIQVKGGCIRDQEAIRCLTEACYTFYDRELPLSIFSDGEDTETELKPLQVIPRDLLGTLMRRLNKVSVGLGIEMGKKLARQSMTFGDLLEYLDGAISIIQRPRELDCRKALIFVVGNIDEAYTIDSEISPDVDCDTYHEISKAVTKTQIKEALKKRFRPEQISRLGHNLISYYTLSKDSFNKVIRNEVSRIIERFKEIDSLKVTVGQNIYKLLFAEGVTPVQGVRPTLAAINTIFTPYLGKALVNKEDYDSEVLIDCPDTIFNTQETTIILKFKDSGKEMSYTQELQLGKLRSPGLRQKGYICATHEASHAVAFTYLSGIAPVIITSVSSNGGGFCSTFEGADKDKEIESREEIDRNVMVSLAGYLGELEFYEPKRCLMGSGSDIKEAWRKFSHLAYRGGYFSPISYSSASSESVPDGLPNGISDEDDHTIEYYSGSITLRQAIRRRFEELIEETKDIIKGEHNLIKNLSLYLGERGTMDSEKFLEFVKKYGNKLTPEFMESTRKSNSPEYYINKLKS